MDLLSCCCACLKSTPFLLHALQPGKCLYTTVRELVENALDSAESVGELPVIDITMYEMQIASCRTSQMIRNIYLAALLHAVHREEVSRARLNEIRGLEHQERLDEQLYHDYETEDQKRV
jgi:hypothetical protein